MPVFLRGFGLGLVLMNGAVRVVGWFYRYFVFC